MEKEFIKIIKKLKGTALLVGYDDDSNITNCIKSNKNIEESYSLTNNKKNNNGKNKIFADKKINIKKLKRFFGDIRFDYLICNFSIIKPYLKSFVSNSILLSQDKIYILVSNDEYDIGELRKRYERHKTSVEVIGKEKNYIIIIENKNSKFSHLKRPVYYIKDTFHDLIEKIAEILMS